MIHRQMFFQYLKLIFPLFTFVPSLIFHQPYTAAILQLPICRNDHLLPGGYASALQGCCCLVFVLDRHKNLPGNHHSSKHGVFRFCHIHVILAVFLIKCSQRNAAVIRASVL